MIGYIDVGGGMRAVYGAGVLDRCIDDGQGFPYYLGVSAGAANIISFLGDHRGRTLRFYRDYSHRPEYMGFGNWFKTGEFIGLDYIYGDLTVSGGEDPLDYEKMMSKDCRFGIVVTNAHTGKAEYLDHKSTIRDEYFEIKATCCIPIICPPRKNDYGSYFDGGVADPLPVRKAFLDGCDKVVVTLTLPRDYYKIHKAPVTFYKAVLKKYPETARLMYSMIDKYNADLDYLKELEKQGKVLILAPDDCCGVKTLRPKKSGVEALYKKGYEDAEKIRSFISEK